LSQFHAALAFNSCYVFMLRLRCFISLSSCWK